MPRFSIILPVRNGGNYVKECVNSILSQTYTGFNLIVLDNASTDGTLEWISSVKDDRIIIYPSGESLSIEKNWARIVGVDKNEFITLIGHDDILDPDYLSEMDNLINRYPDAGLYQAHFRYIDSKGNTIRSCRLMKEKQEPGEVLSNFLSVKTDVMGTGFMMRGKDYDRIGGIPPYPSLLFADFELWINLTKQSYLAVAAKECFAFRIHQSTTTSSSDAVMLKAFEQFVTFLERLGNEDKKLGNIISNKAAGLLNFYCQGLASRLLRTPKSNRNGQTVKGIILHFKLYAERLMPGNTFYPLNNKTTRLALYIDSNFITRNLFLVFKKVYPKPITG